MDANYLVDNVKKKIFNHDISDASSKEEIMCLSGSTKYSCRSLGLTNPEDIIQLPPDLREYWDTITGHYDRIGLSYTNKVIWDNSFELLRNFQEYELSLYIFGEKAHEVRPDAKWFKIVQTMNSKNNFIVTCNKLSIDVPETQCFESKETLTNYSKFEFPVYLKISTSVSGLGVIICHNALELRDRISLLESGISFQVQNEVDAQTFINIQYFIEGNNCMKLLISEQVLDGFKHAGNKYPTSYDDAWEVTDPIAMELKKRGMKGYFAFDVAVTKSRKYLAIECNPRINGATYPTIIAKKLGIESWIMKNFVTNVRDFRDLDLKQFEYNHSKKHGIVIVNWGCMNEGKLGVLIAGSPEKQNKIEQKLKEILV